MAQDDHLYNTLPEFIDPPQEGVTAFRNSETGGYFAKLPDGSIEPIGGSGATGATGSTGATGATGATGSTGNGFSSGQMNIVASGTTVLPANSKTTLHTIAVPGATSTYFHNSFIVTNADGLLYGDDVAIGGAGIDVQQIFYEKTAAGALLFNAFNSEPTLSRTLRWVLFEFIP